MRLGTNVGPGADPKQAAARVQELERSGIDVVWVPELYSFDGVSMMGYLAGVTERIEIGSSILPFYSRTPTLTAMTAAGLDAVSGGRFILGIGASGPQVIEGWHGVRYDAPVGRVRELVDICRMVWRRDRVAYDGRHYTLPLPEEEGTGLGKPLKLINHPVRERIPIYVASLGPKNVEMTAEIAEGWIPIFFWPEKASDVWGDSLRRGKEQRDGSLPPLETVASATVAIGEGLEHLRDAARPMLALYIGGMGAKGRNFYNDLCRRYGFEREAEQIQDRYLSGQRDEAAKLVPPELLEGISLVGPEGYVKERLAAFAEAGVTVLNVTVGGPDARGTIEKIREWAGD